MRDCTNAAIDPIATGRNILSLRMERGLSVRDIQHYFNFDEPRAIYKWQAGQSLPSLDNLYSLSALFDVPMDSIIVGKRYRTNSIEPQDLSCGSHFLRKPLCERAKRFYVCPIKDHTANLSNCGWTTVSEPLLQILDSPGLLPQRAFCTTYNASRVCLWHSCQTGESELFLDSAAILF